MNEKQIFFFSFIQMYGNQFGERFNNNNNTHTQQKNKTKQKIKAKERESEISSQKKIFFWQMGERKHQHLNLFEKIK